MSTNFEEMLTCDDPQYIPGWFPNGNKTVFSHSGAAESKRSQLH